MQKGNVIFMILLIALTASGFLALNYFEDRSPLPFLGEEGHTIPDFNFTDQLNKEFNAAELEGKVVIVDYFFTSCPSICPEMTRNLQKIHDLYRNKEDLMILSFTVDPKRDDPERLMRYAETYNVDHDSWKFLTGEKNKLYALARKGFKISATDGAGDETDFIHSENMVLIDKNKRIRGMYVGTDEASMNQLQEDIEKLR